MPVFRDKVQYSNAFNSITQTYEEKLASVPANSPDEQIADGLIDKLSQIPDRLTRPELAYIKSFVNRFEAQGVTEEELTKLHTILAQAMGRR